MRNFNVQSDLVLTKAIQPVIYKQYDNGDSIEVELYEDGIKLELTTETVLAFFELEDGTVIQKTCTISNGNAIAILDNNVLSVGGKLKIEFTIYEGDKQTTTRTVLAKVEKSIDRNNAVTTEPRWDLVQQLLDDGLYDDAEYARTQGDYAKSVGDENKTTWLTPVATYADIAITYTAPVHGDTVFVNDTGKIYRYISGTGWKQTQEYNNTAINDIQNKLSLQDQQTQTLVHGVNVVNSDIPSSMKVEFYGNTLVNYISDFNRWALHANATMDSDKKITLNADANYQQSKLNVKSIPNQHYHFRTKTNGRMYITENLSDGTSKTILSSPFTASSNSVSLDVKLDNNTTTGTFTFEEPRLYEIDQATYDKIGVSLLDSDVERMFPYVDSIKGVKNPVISVSGQNLLPPFTEWALHAESSIVSPYELAFSPTGGGKQNTYRLKVNKSTDYTLNITHDALISVYGVIRGSDIISPTSSQTVKFNTGNDDEIVVSLRSSTSGSFTFKNPMLNLGSTALPFEERNTSYIMAEVDLYGNDSKKDILYHNESLNRWEVKRDFGTEDDFSSLSWSLASTGSGYKVVQTLLPNNFKTLVDATKYDGGLLEGTNVTPAKADQILANPTSSTYMRISISDTDATGYDLTTTAGIQTYFTDKNYFLLYQLAESVIEPVTVEGDLSIQGDAQVEVGEGVIPREETDPKVSSDNNTYHINYNNEFNVAHNPLKNKVKRIISIYKNSELDSNWIVKSDSAYGNQRAYINADLFDTTATYTVTYEILDKHDFTTNLNEVKATFANSLKSSLQSNVTKTSDIATQTSINTNSIVDIYGVLKANGLL